MENLRYNHHAQTTLTWLRKLMQGSDVFGNTVQFSETYLVCVEKKSKHSSELRTGIAARAADVGIAKKLIPDTTFHTAGRSVTPSSVTTLLKHLM